MAHKTVTTDTVTSWCEDLKTRHAQATHVHSGCGATRAEDLDPIVHGSPGVLGQQRSHVQLVRGQVTDVGADLLQGPFFPRVKQVVEPGRSPTDTMNHNT